MCTVSQRFVSPCECFLSSHSNPRVTAALDSNQTLVIGVICGSVVILASSSLSVITHRNITPDLIYCWEKTFEWNSTVTTSLFVMRSSFPTPAIKQLIKIWWGYEIKPPRWGQNIATPPSNKQVWLLWSFRTKRTLVLYDTALIFVSNGITWTDKLCLLEANVPILLSI